jgi:hypothetical protein
MTQPDTDIQLTGEEEMSCLSLYTAYEEGRTAHMVSRMVMDHGRLVEVQELVITAEMQHGGQWRKLMSIGTDLNDDSQPVFIDLVKPGYLAGERVVQDPPLAMSSMVNVRGLSV